MCITTPWFAIALSPWMTLPALAMVLGTVIVLVWLILAKKQPGTETKIRFPLASIHIRDHPIDHNTQNCEQYDMETAKQCRQLKREKRRRLSRVS